MKSENSCLTLARIGTWHVDHHICFVAHPVRLNTEYTLHSNCLSRSFHCSSRAKCCCTSSICRLWSSNASSCCCDASTSAAFFSMTTCSCKFLFICSCFQHCHVLYPSCLFPCLLNCLLELLSVLFLVMCYCRVLANSSRSFSSRITFCL